VRTLVVVALLALVAAAGVVATKHSSWGGRAGAAAPLSCRATVIVDDTPPGAELLVRAGVAPLDVGAFPAGARCEFVAMADGYAPRRSGVPRGAGWDRARGEPLFEVAIQLDKNRETPEALDPWPASDASAWAVAPEARATVHVVTTPRGAEVLVPVPAGPDGRIDGLPCRAAVDLLLASPTGRKRLRVEAMQLTPKDGATAVTAHISARQ
jgi:hypothetical protein